MLLIRVEFPDQEIVNNQSCTDAHKQSGCHTQAELLEAGGESAETFTNSFFGSLAGKHWQNQSAYAVCENCFDAYAADRAPESAEETALSEGQK